MNLNYALKKVTSALWEWCIFNRKEQAPMNQLKLSIGCSRSARDRCFTLQKEQSLLNQCCQLFLLQQSSQKI